MVFKKEGLVDREKEIGNYLLQAFPITHISKKTGLSNKTINAHIRNMMKKFSATDIAELLRILKKVNP